MQKSNSTDQKVGGSRGISVSMTDAVCKKCYQQSIGNFVHCKDCCYVFDITLEKHCFACCAKQHSVSILPNQKHCCHCHECWEETTHQHCKKKSKDGKKCCLVVPNDMTHCCNCKIILASTDDFKHCVDCCENYPTDSTHCCKCRVSYNPMTHVHCCACNRTDDITISHCCKCSRHLVWNNTTHEHCCECKMTWDSTTHEHCCWCKGNWDIGKQDHCRTCHKKWNFKTQKHCNDCCVIWDSKPNDNRVHCCECLMVWNSTTQEHCCMCSTSWDCKTENHCNWCCRIWDLKTTSHCGKCCQTWETNVFSHCCDCKHIYDKTETHCCKCHADLSSMHCSDCCIAFSQSGEDHCHGCRQSWPRSQFIKHCKCCHKFWDAQCKKHCTKCCINYDASEEHCCQCRANYDPSQTHCCDCLTGYNVMVEEHCKYPGCHVIAPLNHSHCCKCKKIWDPALSEEHCSQCCGFFSQYEKHCCKCKTSWDPSKSHCKWCCVTLSPQEKHCCICDNRWNVDEQVNCHCSEIAKFSDTQIKMLWNKHSLSAKYCVSPCLENCDAVVKFEHALRKIGFSSIREFLDDSDNFTIVFHGTPQVSFASNICCNSWESLFRGQIGQRFGTGEYVTTCPKTALDYTGNRSGAIVIAIVINPSVFPSINVDGFDTFDEFCDVGYIRNDHVNSNGESEIIPVVKKLIPHVEIRKSNDEMWFIVENQDDMSFILPIGVMQLDNSIDKCKICPRQSIPHQRLENATSDTLWYEDNGFKKFHPSDANAILDYLEKKRTIFALTLSNGQTYRFDFMEMLQTNLKTGTRRKIHFL